MIGNFRGYAEERHPPPSQFFVFMGQLKLHVMTHGPSLKVGNCLNPLISLATSFKTFLTNLEPKNMQKPPNPSGKNVRIYFFEGDPWKNFAFKFLFDNLVAQYHEFLHFLDPFFRFDKNFQNLKLKKIQTAFNIVFKSFNPFSGPNWIFLRRKTDLEVKKSSDCSKLRPESRKNSLGACSGDPMLLT